MKKLLFITVITVFLNACEKESSSFKTNTANSNNVALAFDVASEGTSLGIYKGVFSTEDSKTRGIIELIMPGVSTFETYYGQYPTATLTLSNGTILTVKADRTISEEEQVVDLAFRGTELSFILNMNDDGTNLTFTNILLNETKAFALVKKHTNRAPATPVSGSYECDDCRGIPALDGSLSQTFSVVITNQSTYSTMTLIGARVFIGDGIQEEENNCNSLVNGDFASCPVSGQTSILNTTMTWNAKHIYSTNSQVNCSDVRGTWTWITNSYGTITGTLRDDFTLTCKEDIAIEDFDGTMPTWTSEPSLPYFLYNNGGDFDYWGPSNGTEGGNSGLIDYNVFGNFLYVQDLRNPNGGTTTNSGMQTASLIFEDINVIGREEVNILFDYDLVLFDDADRVEYILVIDGVDGPRIEFFRGLNGTGVGGISKEGTKVINIPNGATTIGFELRLRQNGANDYAGFDNFKISALPI